MTVFLFNRVAVTLANVVGVTGHSQLVETRTNMQRILLFASVFFFSGIEAIENKKKQILVNEGELSKADSEKLPEVPKPYLKESQEERNAKFAVCLQFLEHIASL